MEFTHTSLLSLCIRSIKLSDATSASSLAKTVYLCFDGDAAGQSALMKAKTLFEQKANVEIKNLQLPIGCKDADEALKKYGKEVLRIQ